MPNSNDGNVFSANIPEIERGALKLQHLSDLMESISKNLFDTIYKNPNLGKGNDDISKSLAANYVPAANDGLSFLSGLGTLLNLDGNTTYEVSGLLNDVNQTTTNNAGGVPGHRR